MPKAQDVTGKRFGKLIADSFTGESKKNQGRMWKCICDCGGVTVVSVGVLNSGGCRSCGCIVSEIGKAWGMTNFKHGEGHGRKTKEYRAWTGMKERCYNKANVSYPFYGGRGIKVCDRWLNSYVQFLSDMGRAEKLQSVDRIDVNSDYSPENCRWASPKEQGRNKTNTKFIMVGDLKLKAIDLANEFNVPRNEIYLYERVRKLIKEKYGCN